MIQKKGDITDIPILLIVIFILALGFFIYAFIIPQIADGLMTAGVNNSEEGNTAILELELIGTELIQKGFFFLFAGLVIGTMISAFFVRTHPIFLFLYIIFLGITVVLGTYLGNAYEQMTEIEIFAETLASQTLINFVMNNIITIMIAVGALSMVIVFAKFSTGGTSRV
ncbi:MAG: hypothetical protein ACTSQA_04465 [Candidatus Heimdallarchaeaceae archaeon]